MAVEYYFKMPQDMQERDAIVLDPYSPPATRRWRRSISLKETKPKSIRFVCLLAAPGAS